MNYPSVPVRAYDGNEAREQLVLVVRRLLYILQWIEQNATCLLDGRHHEAFETALREVQKSLDWNKPDPAWEGVLRGVNDEDLSSRGLSGAPLNFKVGVFNQHFENFLDAGAQFKAAATTPEVSDREVEEFQRRVWPFSRKVARLVTSAEGSLSAGGTILGSIMLIVPMADKVKNAFEGLKELAETAEHGVKAAGMKS